MSLFKRQSVCKHSAVPLSVAVPLRDTAAHCPLSRADGITPVTRPRLLASSFSRRLQGDFLPASPSALHQTAALFAVSGGYSSFSTPTIRLSAHPITFFGFVNRISRQRQENSRGKTAVPPPALRQIPPPPSPGEKRAPFQASFLSLIAELPACVLVHAAQKHLMVPEFQQLTVLHLVEGDDAPLGIHPDAPQVAHGCRLFHTGELPSLKLVCRIPGR